MATTSALATAPAGRRDGATGGLVARLRRLGPLGLLGYALLTAWALLSLMPIYWMVTNSLKNIGELITFPPEVIPTQLTLVNYREVFFNGPFLRWLANTIVVALSVTGGQVLFCSMAGYAFAKKEFPGKNVIFWTLMASIMIPGWVTLVPLYVMMASVHWIDTFQALIVPHMASAWGTFLIKQFMQTLPTEFFDAARIDGASELGVFWSIVLPLAKPGLAVLGIFAFAGAWNEFLYPLLMTSRMEMRTIQAGMALWVGPWGVVSYGLIMAGSSIAALPMVGIFLGFQRYFLQGVTLGGLKG